MAIREMKDGFEFVANVYPFNVKDAIVITEHHNDMKHVIDYIRDHQIEKAAIYRYDLSFLSECPTLKYVDVFAPCDAGVFPPAEEKLEFDMSALYSLPEVLSLNCGNVYGFKSNHIAQIEFEKIKGLQDLSFTQSKKHQNAQAIQGLKSLHIYGYDEAGHGIKELFSGEELDTLCMTACKVQTLEGIEKAEKMQCLYLRNNRKLQDIHALESVSRTLKALVIDRCPQIKDFSILAKLKSLEYLCLEGGIMLENLSFIKEMENLKNVRLDVKDIRDGDLTPLLRISSAQCVTIKRHYNLKESDLPDGSVVHGNENIEVWRRLN